MPMKFKKGDAVRQVVKPIEGPVLGVAIVDDVVQYEVGWTDDAGEAHSRYFTEEQLDAVPPAEAPPEAPAA